LSNNVAALDQTYQESGLTLRRAAALFSHCPTARILAPVTAAVIAIRVGLGQCHWSDLVIPAVIVGLEPFTEWIIHVGLLHWKPLPETSSIISGTPHGVDPRRGLHASTPTAQHAGSYTDSTLHEGRNSAYVAPIGTKSKGKDTRGRSLGIAPIRSGSYPVGVSIKAPADRRRQMFVDSC
jgi:hypothetical protein